MGKRGSGDSILGSLQKRVKTGEDSYKEVQFSVTSEKKTEKSKNYEQEVVRNLLHIMTIDELEDVRTTIKSGIIRFNNSPD